MSKEQISFKIIFRSPQYPVIVVTEEGLYSAYNIEQLGTLCVFSEPIDADFEVTVIDSSGDEFKYFTEHTALMPGFLNKKWTKKQIIELYNRNLVPEDNDIEYSLKSISSKKVSRIVGEICELLKS
ncbi:MAG: hypothetical protein QNI95_16075 [Desulfobacterales bacterium]|nr:hypothetical protein [Desulfobacterales bacterium]